MKKIGHFIRNLYRVTLAKPKGEYSEKSFIMDENTMSDSYLRDIIRNDAEHIEPDPQLYKALEKIVASKRNHVAGNSIADFVLPFFSVTKIEFKMAIMSLIIVVSLGINPPVQYQNNRKISPFSLADTLIDSSKLEGPFYLLPGERH